MAGARLDAAAPTTTALGGIEESSSPESKNKITKTLTYEDFTAYASVKEWLRDYAGVDKDDWSKYDDLEIYVPREVTVSLDIDRVSGSLGTAAVDGYIFTGLTYSGNHDFSAAYLMVLDMRGKLQQLSPVYGKYMVEQGYSTSDDKSVHDKMFQPLGLKMFNSTHVLLSLSDDGTSGPRALWEWRTDTWTSLCDALQHLLGADHHHEPVRRRRDRRDRLLACARARLSPRTMPVVRRSGQVGGWWMGDPAAGREGLYLASQPQRRFVVDLVAHARGRHKHS